jgi:dUTP pyrophosphatase
LIKDLIGFYIRTIAMDSITLEVVSADLIMLYQGASHNYETDSGYDLYCPETLTLPPQSTTLVDLMVRCELKSSTVHGYYLLPRSSIYKTPLRLANSVGLIDYNYRGTLKVALDNRSSEPFTLKRGDRFFQLTMPSLAPFKVTLGTVNQVTDRGAGGFGSTDRKNTIA